MLYTTEEKLRQLLTMVQEAQRRADAAMEYAERSARLHHAAICRLNKTVSGSDTWPGRE